MRTRSIGLAALLAGLGSCSPAPAGSDRGPDAAQEPPAARAPAEETAPSPPPAAEAPAPPPREPPPAEPPPRVEPPAAGRGVLEPADAPEQKRCIELVEGTTGQRFTRAVPVFVFTPEELRKEVESWGDFSPDNILGFYKPSTKALYLVPEKAGNRREFGLRLHEAVHALQDQLYDLARLEAGATTTDARHAARGLIEGEAVQVMVDALSETQPAVAQISKVRVPDDSRDPEAFRRVYTYAYGTRFVEHLKRRGGYRAVHEAFARMPVSSEQVLHPEKYDEPADLPDGIAATAESVRTLLPPGYAVSSVDTVGEFETRLRFVPHEATAPRSEAIAAGWGGDVEIVAKSGNRSLSLWLTTWDTAEDALEFAEATQLLPGCRTVSWDGRRRVILLSSDEGLGDEHAEALHSALRAVPIEYR